jgi:hypothetical protein
VRCGLLTLAARCETDAEFTAFVKRAAEIKLVESTTNRVWQVKAKSGTVELEAGLDLDQKQSVWRRFNGKDWPVNVFSVNGRDLVKELIAPKIVTH